jgi:hypothetical protein
MGEAKLGEHGTGGGFAEILNKVLSQYAHCDGIEYERALSGEMDDTSLRIKLQQFAVMQIFHMHRHNFIKMELGIFVVILK